jgi:5-methylcytosine-specific restriction endonuclease McrA
MTFLVRQDSELDFVDLKASNLDAFYLNKSDLAPNDLGAERLLDLLREIVRLPEIHRIRDGNKLKFQWAFHLVLLIDSLIAANYVDASWRGKVIGAFEQFRGECADATLAFKERGERSPHYDDFVQPLSGSGSDTAEKIRLRHRFLLQSILRLVEPKPKDPLRLFGPIEREIMWYRQQGKCAHPACARQTPLAEMQAHHVREHTQGGQTSPENGVLLCKNCHQDRVQLQSLEQFLLKQIKNPLRSESAANTDDLDDAIGATPQKLRVEINWPALGKGTETQVLHHSTETDTVVALCERLIEMFGDEAVRWMTDRPVTRFPISMHPQTTFKNPVSGSVYSHRAISGTPFFVCTHSSHPEKVRRLQSWASGLPDPFNAAITVGVATIEQN